jgi:hypothetical protein
MAKKLINIDIDDFLDNHASADRRLKQASGIIGRKRPDQSQRMAGDNNVMAGKVSPNRGKTMPAISEKVKGQKRSEETKKKIGETRKAKGLTNSWVGQKRPDQSQLMSDPKRNKGAASMKEMHTCPHCGKTTNLPNYTRWHGDNCKHK